MKHLKNNFFKVAIFVATLFSWTSLSAQTYNNWLLSYGYILNFNTNPPSIDKIDFNCRRIAFALSDENGNIVLYGGDVVDNTDENHVSCTFIIKNAQHQILVSLPNVRIINITGCKSNNKDGSFYVSVITSFKPHYNIYSLRLYSFDNKGVLKDSLISNSFNYSSLAFFMPYVNGDVNFFVYVQKNKTIESYKMSENKILRDKTYEVELPNFYSNALFYTIAPFMNGRQMFCSFSEKVFLLDFDNVNNVFSVKKEYQNLGNIVLSNNEKYIVSLNDGKLFRYELTDNFELKNGKLIYDSDTENISRIDDIRLGVDGKIYAIEAVLGNSPNRIIYFDNIESNDITIGVIEGDLSKSLVFFPNVPHFFYVDNNPCKESKKSVIICE